nr:MAG TPA: hypothetical protein [Caudoviricetes sp.]
MPYTLTTYDGEKIELMEQSPDKIRDLAADAGLVAIQDAKGQIHYLGKGRLASIDYTKPEGPVTPLAQRLAMGDQKDNRSEGPLAEANKAWRDECGHDYKRMGNKQERDAFITNWLLDNAQQ